MGSITETRGLGRWAAAFAAVAGLALAGCGGEEETFPIEAPILPAPSATQVQTDSQQNGSTGSEVSDDSAADPQDAPDDPTIAPTITNVAPTLTSDVPDGPTVPASSSPTPDPSLAPGCDGGWVAIMNSGSSSRSVVERFADQARTALGDGSIDVIDGGSCPSLPAGSTAIGPFSSAEDALAACQSSDLTAGNCFATPLTMDAADSEVRVAAG